MRILHLIRSLDRHLGGPPQGLLSLTRAQADRGHDVAILPALPGGQPADAGDVVTVVPPPGSPLRMRFRDARFLRSLREAAAHAEILHVHGLWWYHVSAAARVGGERETPFILRPQGHLGRAARRHHRLRKAVYMLLQRASMNRAAAVHCTSEKERRETLEIGLKPRHFVVPQPAEGPPAPGDAERARALHDLCPQLRPEQFAILYMGRLAPIKRLGLLVEAFADRVRRGDDVYLILAGPEEDRAVVRDLRRRLGRPELSGRHCFTGFVGGADKAAVLRRADAFVQPSAHENFGISVAEAMLAGRPCIVSSGVALADEIRRGGAGLVCGGASGEYAAALGEFIRDRDRRERMAAAAAEVAAEFLPARVAAALEDQYEQCIREAFGR